MFKPITIFFCTCILCLQQQAFATETILFDGSNPALLGNNPTNIPALSQSLAPTITSPSNNQITMSGGTVPQYIFGGGSRVGGVVSDNQIFLTGGTVNESIYGGFSTSGFPTTTAGTAKNNTITMTSGTVRKSIIGGYGIDAIGNHITINGGTVGTSSTFSEIIGGIGARGATGDVYGNSVTINGGNFIVRSIVGGQNDEGNAHNNSVTITGGTIPLSSGNIYGGRATVTPGSNVYDNTIRITGGTIGSLNSGANGNIYAGIAGVNGTITNNSVILSGGHIWGYVGGTANASPSWITDNNNLHVDGAVSVGGIGTFQNTRIDSSGNLNIISDNFAKIRNSGYSAQFMNVHNDGALTFYNMPYGGIAPGILGLDQNSGQILGTYTGSGYIGLDVRIRHDASSQDADRITFTNAPAQQVILGILPTADSTHTINNPVRIATIDSGATANAFKTLTAGFGIYAYSILQQGNDYYLALTEKFTESLGHIYFEAASVALAQVMRSPDLLFRNVLNAGVEKTEGKGLSVFTTVAYANERINTADHVDIEGIDALAALTYNKGTPWSVGLFGEYFTGEYDATSKVHTSQGIFHDNADGDLSSAGAGLFIQYRPDDIRINGIPLGWRFEASARAGRSTLDFDEHTTYDSSFERSSLYFGVAGGAAYVFQTSDSSTLELYSHGIWTRLEGETVKDGIGQKIHFHDADSLRILTGARYDFAVTEKIRPFVGLGLDWEISGKPKVDIDNFRAETDDLSGPTGVAEFGVSVRLLDSWTADARGTAMAGKREGFSGSLQLKYEF